MINPSSVEDQDLKRLTDVKKTASAMPKFSQLIKKNISAIFERRKKHGDKTNPYKWKHHKNQVEPLHRIENPSQLTETMDHWSIFDFHFHSRDRKRRQSKVLDHLAKLDIDISERDLESVEKILHILSDMLGKSPPGRGSERRSAITEITWGPPAVAAAAAATTAVLLPGNANNIQGAAYPTQKSTAAATANANAKPQTIQEQLKTTAKTKAKAKAKEELTKVMNGEEGNVVEKVKGLGEEGGLIEKVSRLDVDNIAEGGLIEKVSNLDLDALADSPLIETISNIFMGLVGGD